MSVAATSNGNTLGFTIQITNSAQAGAQVRKFAKDASDAQNTMGKNRVRSAAKEEDEITKIQRTHARARAVMFMKSQKEGSDFGRKLNADEIREYESLAKKRRAITDKEARARSAIESRTYARSRESADAMNTLAESTMRAARGFAYLGLMSEKSTEKMVHGLLAVQGAMDVGMGTFRAGNAVGRLGRNARRTLSGGGAIGLGGRAAMLATNPLTLAGGAAAIGGGLGAWSVTDHFRGNPIGGFNDSVGSRYAQAATSIHENTGGYGLAAADIAFRSATFGPQMAAMALGYGSFGPSDWRVTGQRGVTALNKNRISQLGLANQENVGIRSAMANASYSRSGATYGDIGSMFDPMAFELMAGSAGSLSHRLGVGTRRDLGADAAGLVSRRDALSASLSGGKGDSDTRLAAEKQILEINQQLLQVREEIATSAATQLRITQEEANVAKGRLQSAQVGFGLQDRGTQNQLLRLGKQMNDANGLEGAAREAALSRFTPQQLQLLQGVGTESTTRFVQEAAQLKARQANFDPIFGQREMAMEGAAATAAGGIEETAKGQLKAAGVGNTGGKMADIVVRELKALEAQNLESFTKIIQEEMKKLRAEMNQDAQKKANEANSVSLLRKANNQFIA